MTYHLIRLLSRIVNTLPLSGRHAIGNCIGEVSWLLLPHRRREMVINNILNGLSLRPQDAQVIAKASTTRFGRMIIEVFYQDKLNLNSVNALVAFRGREHLDAALAEGKGCILATAHSGNWEMMSAALCLNGYPLAAIAQKQHNEQMDRFINEQRRAPGAEIVYRSEVRDMVRLLDRGKIIGLLMDQDAHQKGVFVPFFGRLASTPAGPAAIARLRGAPIVPAFIHEVAPGKHEIIVHQAVRVAKTADRDADIYATTLQLTNIIEAHIRQYPSEWFWLHNRWKTQPPGCGR
ncbi:MAG: phosphatidylinositol mannoside acyltransferase [Anaerosporomusa subterranea]|jgi:KDO2-lipid IV(A) lauroyltransferase|nr:phosphatidylinositol mannoside acyltransferase [Anaerosporomusa subterranea]